MKRFLSVMVAAIFVFLAGASFAADKNTANTGVEKTKDGIVVKGDTKSEKYKALKAKITVDEAVDIAKKKVEGEVVSVEFEKGAYEVKIKTPKGKIKEVYVRPSGEDKKSGKGDDDDEDEDEDDDDDKK